MAYKLISDYGLIGNMHSCALVNQDGSIDWCCLPRFDSPSTFAAILDDEKGGSFSIRPQGQFTSHQTYIPNTNVLKTTLEVGGGSADVIDFMPCFVQRGNRLSRLDQIHRIVECTSGVISLDLLFDPKMDYARTHTQVKLTRLGAVAENGHEEISLASNNDFSIDNGRVISNLTMKRGGRSLFVLSYGSAKPMPTYVYKSEEKLARTVSYWEKKAEDCKVDGPWSEAIIRSYLALHLLVYSPTGAIIAAPTISLPEEIGGERNWDYRYSWLRDASLTLVGRFLLYANGQ